MPVSKIGRRVEGKVMKMPSNLEDLSTNLINKQDFEVNP